jgi:BirA family biotin operon repressor/biotin-[acetyl-CoA-carboxylase] ligase
LSFGLASALQQWEGKAVSEWQQLWRVPDLRILAITGSTNDDLRALAEAGSPELTVVIAEEQTAGRGRRGRQWHGAFEKSLHLSALLRPRDISCLTAAPIRVGMAAAQALQSRTGVPTRVKWPNDLDVQQRKLGGILCESVLGSSPFIVVGIGVNVYQTHDDFPPDVAARATSIRLEGGTLDRAAVAGAIVDSLRSAAPRIASPFSSAELTALRGYDVLRGHRIEVDGVPAGVAQGISESGALLVQRDGKLEEVLSGTVRPIG